MAVNIKKIPAESIAEQSALCAEIKRGFGGLSPKALVDTYGCQQNEADSEIIRGFLRDMGFAFTENENEADLIVLNTCAVREHAEQRVFGNLGALNHTKKANPAQIIVLCGCMAARQEVRDKIKKSFGIVDLVFSPDELWRFPELLEQVLRTRKRVFSTGGGEGCIAEGLPHARTEGVRAWLSIMYGCNNFCTYCIVPYTRLRERSREPEDVVAEAKRLVSEGYKEITLLGQNVNSYGKNLDCGASFPKLLREVDAIDGDFVIRFMTSHPRDAGEELFRAMAECQKCESHLHLPLQSGSDRILRLMNRHYDSAKYLAEVTRVRELIPDIVLTTDIIVGFPDETEEDFAQTLEVVRRVRFDAMFTFIYSKRGGTPAAEMYDPYTREDKQRRFDALLELQNAVSEEKHRAYIGACERVLIDGEDRESGVLTARTKGGRLVRVAGGRELVGSFANVKITNCNTWALKGEVI